MQRPEGVGGALICILTIIIVINQLNDHYNGPYIDHKRVLWSIYGPNWGRSSTGGTPLLQGGGWEFESPRLHQ